MRRVLLMAVVGLVCGATTAAALSQPPRHRWGALAFTADGSYSRAWGQATKAEAEAAVLKNCTGFERGRCELLSFDAGLCVALASYRPSPAGPRHLIAYTGGGGSLAEARHKAKSRCDADERTAGRCHLRTAVCADGRK